MFKGIIIGSGGPQGFFENFDHRDWVVRKIEQVVRKRKYFTDDKIQRVKHWFFTLLK